MHRTFLSATVVCIPLVACQSASPEPEPVAPWNCSARVELSTLWKHLSERYDRDGDGAVTRAEYARGEVRFANYDRNGDGILREADFPTDTHFNGFSHMLIGRADADEDERVTADEWRTFCAGFDVDGDGRVVRAEVEETMGPWTSDWRLFLLSFDQDTDGDFDETDLALTFRDQDYDGDGDLEGKELEGWSQPNPDDEGEPPAPGELAPDFELSYADASDRTFRLSEHRAQPVALIFGSYT